MTTVFANETDRLYAAFFEPTPAKRRLALEDWIRSATPSIHAAVSAELKAYVSKLTADCPSQSEWVRKEEKLRKIRNDFHLTLKIELSRVNPKEHVLGCRPKAKAMTSELDLHGQTVLEALPMVDRFLLENYQNHVKKVWVIHGKGTGVLRDEVRRHVNSHRLVASWAPADKSHGEDGAIEINIKDRTADLLSR